jgi:hypothetical protein
LHQAGRTTFLKLTCRVRYTVQIPHLWNGKGPGLTKSVCPHRPMRYRPEKRFRA